MHAAAPDGRERYFLLVPGKTESTVNIDEGHPAPPVTTPDGQTTYTLVEVPPQYPGGIQAYLQYLNDNVKYPSEAIAKKVEGTVVVHFFVEKDGTISNPTVVRSIDKLLDAEALRVVKGMPAWTPGKQKGEPVRVKFTMPVRFKVQ